MKKDVVLAVLITFCLSVTLFSLVPSKSATGDYDPWADIDDDGKIDIKDVSYVARMFGTNGIAINKTELKRAVELQQLLEHILNKNYTDWYNGLVGYWKLDEGTGNMTVDSSGNGNDGILINDPTWIDGKYGKALNLNGTNYVEVADSESLEVQNFTLEAWIYMTERPYEQGNAVAIIHKYTTDAEASGIGYMLLFQNPTSTDDNLVLASGYPMAGRRILVQYNSTIDLSLNEWHHVVGTFDGYTATLYIDGIPRKSMTYPEHIGILYWKSIQLRLGAGMSEGLIDNAMIYNRTLSAEEVVLHYLLPPL